MTRRFPSHQRNHKYIRYLGMEYVINGDKTFTSANGTHIPPDAPLYIILVAIKENRLTSAIIKEAAARQRQQIPEIKKPAPDTPSTPPVQQFPQIRITPIGARVKIDSRTEILVNPPTTERIQSAIKKYTDHINRPLNEPENLPRKWVKL